MNKNNLMRVFIFLSVFFILITSLAYSKLEEGAGTVIGGSFPSDADTSISSETTDPSPTDITKPSTETWTEDDEEFYDYVMGLSSEEQNKLTEEEINKFRNTPFRNVGDESSSARIPFNGETGDGNIGATTGEFEIKGENQLGQFKTLTSDSGKVIFLGNSASDIESISIKDGEITNINFKNKDSENEVLIAQARGEGIWSSFSKEEQKEEGGSISFGEEDLITADKGICFRIGDNKVTIEEPETKIKIEPLTDFDSYYDKGAYIGASINVKQGEIYVDGETSKLKISYASAETEEEQEKIELYTKSLFSNDPKEFSILKKTETPKEETEIIFGFDGSKYIFLQNFEKDQINFFEVPRIESVDGEQESTSQQEEIEANIQLLQTEKEELLLLQNKIQETLTKFKDSNSLLFDYIAEREYNDYRIEKLENAIENLDPSDIDYKENIIYLEEKKGILTNRNSELDLLLENKLIKDQYNDYLKLKDEETNINQLLEETETKMENSIFGSVKVSAGAMVTIEEGDKLDSVLEEKLLSTLEEDINVLKYQESDNNPQNLKLTEKAKGIKVGDKTLYDILKEKGESSLTDLNIILAWIDQESLMSQNAELGGCVGFTQASAIAFKDLINRNPDKYGEYSKLSKDELTEALKKDASLNLDVGFDYMNLLKTTYEFSQEKVESNYKYTGSEDDISLMAYNAGPTVTKDILTAFGKNGGDWTELKTFLGTDEALNIFKDYKESYGITSTDTEETINTNLKKKINIVINYVENINKNAGST